MNRAVILAAGRGTRLGGGIPKILRTVAGRTVLRRHMASLEDLGVAGKNVTVVTGWMGETVERAAAEAGMTTVYSELWKDPGTLSSFLAVPPSKDPVLVIHGDLVWECGLAAEALDSQGDIVIPYDPALRLDKEAMKVEAREGRLIHLSKQLPPERSLGESMGLFLVRRHGDLHDLGSSRDFPRGSSLDLCITAAAGSMDVRTVPARGKVWEEIDTPDDLRAAEEKFLEGR